MNDTYLVLADGSIYPGRGFGAPVDSDGEVVFTTGSLNALDLLLSGRTIHAAEAAAMGLVRTLPAEGFLDAVSAVARELATYSSPRSMRVIKEQVYAGFRQSLADAVTLADSEQLRSLTTEDFREGVSSFFEKRPPAFTGL